MIRTAATLGSGPFGRLCDARLISIFCIISNGVRPGASERGEDGYGAYAQWPNALLAVNVVLRPYCLDTGVRGVFYNVLETPRLVGEADLLDGNVRVFAPV